MSILAPSVVRPVSTSTIATTSPSPLTDQYAMDRIEFRVGSLRKAFGLGEHDAEDIRQEMLLQLWLASTRFDAAKASRRTFTCGVLDRCYMAIARKLKQRRAAAAPLSFEDALGDGRRDPAATGGSSFADQADLRMDMDEALRPLPRRERLVAEDLKQFGKVADVARSRGVNRTSMYRSVAVIRERILESGIDE
ncbi:MAG: sigma-70 family RNA polymerase sigma factor [Phycisphaeraceae bacterium]|nr:sigma-70 family RNA polymerase sigma factor [Phycisphaeraceae bacterium]